MVRATEDIGNSITPCDLLETSRRLSELASRIVENGLAPDGTTSGSRAPNLEDPLGLAGALGELYAAAWANPGRLAEAQLALWADYAALAGHAAQRMLGARPEPVISPPSGDRRFRDDAWEESLVHDLLKQAYLMTARAWLDLVADIDGLSEATQRKLAFSLQQTADAVSPSNFLLTNPEAMRTTLESGGKNLVAGLNNLLADLADAEGGFNVRTTDMEAFEVGENLAVTPGKVVYQNDLMQLIQYEPTTEQVNRRPLLILPPWMNKYYVMDLRPENSMVQWLVDQGHTVFMVSWVNPDERLAHKGFEDYMLEGPIAALDAIERATGQREVNAAGYCLGGILLAATAAWMAAKGDDRIVSVSLLTTMVDFSDAGDVAVFIDEEGLEQLEADIARRGYLDGKRVHATFRTLRANDLIWSFFVNSYLLGQAPKPFDILYWNADATNMPAAVHTFVMRELYLENRLREPGGVRLAGVPIDVGRVSIPAYVLATREDHIAPWKTAYETTQLLSGPTRFVLGASGHIAGAINPPERHKYGYWTKTELPADADAWLEGAAEHAGSWWPDWMRWMASHAGGKVPARVPGEGGLAALEDAPGSYVKVRL